MKTTNTAANTWTFAPTSATVNGRTFPASYSLARNGDVYVFTALRAADGTDMPVRIHVTAAMPMHADAVAAAQAAKAAPVAAAKVDPAPAAQAAAPAPVQDAPNPAKARKAAAPVAAAKVDPAPIAQAAAPAPVQDKPAPVQDKPAPVQDAPKPAKARKAAAPVAAAKVDPAPAAPAAAPAPVQDKPAPAQDVPKSAPAIAKPWVGTTITGKGWNIAFDEQAQRTRVLFQVQPTDAQKAAIEKAGFFWSNQLQSWNKKLTCKAHRAAQELAAALNALA